MSTIVFFFNLVSMGWTGSFTISCVFCKTDFGYINYNFSDFLFHLRDFHNVIINGGLVLAISDQDQTGLDFLHSSLSSFTLAAGGYPEQISCILCGVAVTLVRECGGDYRPSSMVSHLMESHLIVFSTDLFVNSSLLSSSRLTSLIDALLLKNPLRLSRYNNFKARINAVNRQEQEEADEKRMTNLVSIMETILEDAPGQKKRRYKVRSDKGIKKGKMLSILRKPKVSYQCDDCQYKTNDKVHMTRHKRIHTGERPYNCDSCDATFKVSSEVSMHRKRIHLKEKRHICAECGLAFVASAELRRHSFTHLEVKPKPYICDICKYCSSFKGDLNEHRKKHFPPLKTYKCHHCDKEFRNRTHQQRHVKIHDNLPRKILIIH